DTWSLRVTVDAALKKDLETLMGLLSHKLPKRELHEVVREAVRCAIEKHGKRKGAVEPARKRKASIEKPPTRREPTTEVRRQVWKRDGGRCAWVGPDGKRCESTWQLEYDHVRPAALGGEASVANGRLLCRPHQLLSAEQTFGRAHMDKYRQRRGEREATSPGGSAAGIAPEGQPRDADLFPPGAPP
ncbi:MAG TPA: HNH endonuclease, partial [Anaeromyxobacteraceae bacterium]|nr:HNH endonuclease [Anaeromyxobacteraceae bacterium]